MLKSIELEFSETGKMLLPAKGITIFVGPNNSGKSLILREIEMVFYNTTLAESKIVKDYDIEWPSIDQLDEKIKSIRSKMQEGISDSRLEFSHFSLHNRRETTYIDENSLRETVSKQSSKVDFAVQYGKSGVIRLDGRSRFDLTNDQPGGDLSGSPQNVLMHLFKNDVDRLKVRSRILDAFGLYFVLDPTNLGTLRIRLSSEMPSTDEQSLNADARNFHSQAIYIGHASDGVKAFTGIVTAVCSGEFHTILIDEPEAFLHPPLARKLGKILADLTVERAGSLVAATHSADFLMGCVQSSAPVRIVRLEYSGGRSRGRIIDPDALKSFLQRPLMRSANVISGLFHDGVIVCESDNDRVFYAEIYHRLSEGKTAYPSILFVNAQNKQTMRNIVGPLRQFGVPAASIPDIDFVKDGGKDWMEWMTAAQIPELLHIGYGQQRSAINDALAKTGKNMKTEGGIQTLLPVDKSAAEHLFDNLAEFGIFVVRHGEVENWLQYLQVSGKKTNWTIAMLERLGSDPSDALYVKPQPRDVWQFIEGIVSWIRNSARKGTN